jgi:hypothetical protein
MKIKTKVYKNSTTGQPIIMLPKKLFRKVPTSVRIFIPKKYLK